MFGKKRVDLTSGPLLPAIIRFTMPLIIAHLIQILFNAVDLAVLGNLASTSDAASVSVTGSVTGLLINAFAGFSTGTNILLARFLGARDDDNDGTAEGKKGSGVYIGTNVEYAVFVENGAQGRTPVHFLQDAATGHTDEYKRLMEDSMKNA